MIPIVDSPVRVPSCWKEIGVQGDRSCPELSQCGHCRNCDVFARAARTLLDREPLPEYIAERTRQLGQPLAADAREGRPAMIFRLGAEWLAIATNVVQEITEQRPVHALPHRRGSAVLGVVNVRGALTVCVSIARLIGLNAGDRSLPEDARATARLIVLRRGDVRIVCPVDELHGIHRFRDADLRGVPATVAKSKTSYSRAVAAWSGRSVGWLDEALLFDAIARELA